MENFFEIIKTEGSARVGKIKTRNGEINTPFFMPDATRGFVKMLNNSDLEKVGMGPMVVNTYHLYLQPGMEIIRKAGGVHKFMNWKGPILTDSGGYQIFSLAKWRKIKNEGVEFSSEINGQKFFLTPEKAIEIQEGLGSDIAMVLDICPAGKESYQEIKKAVSKIGYKVINITAE